jgi:UPF0755 protein
VVVAVLAAGVISLPLFWPYRGFEGEVFLDFPRGTNARMMAERLEQAGVIRSKWQFLLVRALRRHQLLQAGEYRFARPASAVNVYDRIARGDVFYYELAVPEGQNIFEIAASLERMGMMPASEFLKVARDPSMIRDLAPEAPSLEGYLFPETYRITRRQPAVSICRMMIDRFRRAWRELETPGNVHRVVTLASLVEEEARVPEERELIASVFHNRLKIGMKLDCDPTAVYAAILEGNYRGTLYKSDLESRNPYNTYRRAGLPPGPIANPGLAALRATLNPAGIDDLYFVLRNDGSGRHEFSKDLATHRAAVARYRRVNHADAKANSKGAARPVPKRKKAGRGR